MLYFTNTCWKKHFLLSCFYKVLYNRQAMYVQQSPLYLFSLYSWAPDNILSQILVGSLTQHVDHPTDSPDLVSHVALRGVRVVHHGWRGGGPQLGVSQLCRSVIWSVIPLGNSLHKSIIGVWGGSLWGPFYVFLGTYIPSLSSLLM